MIDINDRLCINNWKQLHDNGYFSKHPHYTGYKLDADEIAQYLILECELTQEDEVLEIGCGYGRIMYALADHVKSIVGIDLHEVPIRQAEIILKDKPNAYTYLCDGDSIPLNDACITFVYAMSAMQHMPRSIVHKYVAECTRVLKPGGRVCLHFLDKDSGGNDDIKANMRGEQSVGWTVAEVENLAEVFTSWNVYQSGKSIYLKGHK